MSSLPPSTSGWRSERRVDRRAADVLRAAEQRLLDARREADGLVAAAREEAREIREAARANGREEAMAQQARLAVEALRRMERWLEAARGQLADALPSFVEALLGRELKLHPDIVLDVVRAATRDLEGALDLRVYVHPEDAAAVQHRLDRVRSDGADNARVRVFRDAEIQRGGCRIESELGVIDASLEAQVRAVECALNERRTC